MLIKFASRLIIFTLLLFFPILSFATLSATTANVIQGTAPYLVLPNGTKLTNLDELLGFSMPDGHGGIVQINNTHTDVIIVPDGVTYADIITLVTADGKQQNLTDVIVNDLDGDALDNTGYALGSITATWRDSDWTVITNLNQPISNCSGLNTLTIKATSVSANTPFGAPSTFAYGSATSKNYAFLNERMTICYIETMDLNVYPKPTDFSAKYSLFPKTGYNPDVWESYRMDTDKTSQKGFSVSKIRANGQAFPTIGFKGASFTLVGPGSDQTLFRCNTSDSRVDLSTEPRLAGNSSKPRGTNCTITFNTETKPTSPITINMEYTADKGITWTKIDSYTIAVSKWGRFMGKTSKLYNTKNDLSGTYDAAIQCGAPAGLSGEANRDIADSYFFSRAEISPVPSMHVPLPLPSSVNSALPFEHYVRDIGSIKGEWGSLNKVYYPESNFGEYNESTYHFWVKDSYINSMGKWVQAMVQSSMGRPLIGLGPEYGLLRIFCKDE